MRPLRYIEKIRRLLMPIFILVFALTAIALIARSSVSAQITGVFLSNDAGNIWTTLTDNSSGTSNPHLPRPRYAYFDREAGTANLYIGTQGRGVWRISFADANADLAITKTAAPNPVVTGTNLTYTINVTNNGPGWDRRSLRRCR
jgi:hypothetical protein